MNWPHTLIAKAEFILSKKITSIIIIAGAILARMLHLVFFSYLGGDRAHQALAAQNFLYGKGVSISRVFANDLSQVVYEPLIKWPPGYSYLLSPFYALFGKNYIMAGLVLDALFAIALILVCRAILRSLGVHISRINLFTIITCFIIYPFYRQPYADAIGITAFLGGIHFALRLCDERGKYIWNLAAMTACLLVCGFSKYLYLPLVVLVPAYLFVKGFAGRSKQLRVAGMYSMLFLAICIGALLIYQKSVSGEAVYITEPTRGFFASNLLSLYPFLPASIVNLETAGIVTGMANQPGSLLYYSYQAVNALMVLVILFMAYRYFMRRKMKNLSLRDDFFYIAFLLSASIVFLLAVLSVRVQKELGYWTYVQEARYFGVVIMLVQLSVFVWWSQVKEKTGKFAWLPLLLVLMMLPEMFRGMVFTANRVRNLGKEEFTWQVEYKLQAFAEDIISRKKKETGIQDVALAGSTDYINNRVALNSHLPQFMETGYINQPALLKTKRPVLLLVIIRSDILPDYKTFTSLPQTEVAGEISGFYFYTTYVQPH